MIARRVKTEKSGTVKSGNRSTIQKRLIKEAVMSNCKHLSAEEIYNEIIRLHPSMSKATVYRNLNQMTDAGDVMRVETGAGADRFDFNTMPHYHVQCVSCGSVYDLSLEYMHDLNKRVQNSDVIGESGAVNGFEILEHNLIFKGKCPVCKTSGINNNECINE